VKISISGLRGIYGQDLDLHQAVRFAGAFSSLLRSKDLTSCALARDTRPSGRIISQAVAAGLMANGIDVYNFGIAPTPLVFRESRKVGAGLVVTSSHNPLEWNGLKFIINGRGLFEDELRDMMEIYSHNESHAAPASNPGSEFEGHPTYLEEVADLVGRKSQDSRVKIGLDPGGGAACGYAGRLFKRLGFAFSSINDVPGVSSRGPDPTADELGDLQGLVRSGGLDYGFALDLDGDRLVVVLSKDAGNPNPQARVEKLGADATLLVCLARVIQMGMTKFVTSIDTSVAIEKYAKEHGARVDYSKVGEANVVNKMLQVGADAGGEGSSAGFIMPGFNMCRDGFLASAIIATLDRKIVSECVEFASQFAQIRTKIPAESALHSRIMSRLPELLARESSDILEIDGIKAIIDENSWVLVRPSNTEHAIRISVESTRQKARPLYDRVSKEILGICENLR